MGHPIMNEQGIPPRWELGDKPYLALWLASVLQACIDFRALVRAGLIVQRQVANPWPLKPSQRGRSHLSDYRSHHAVQRLIDYLYGQGVQDDLEAAGINIHARVLRRLLERSPQELRTELNGVAA